MPSSYCTPWFQVTVSPFGYMHQCQQGTTGFAASWNAPSHKQYYIKSSTTKTCGTPTSPHGSNPLLSHQGLHKLGSCLPYSMLSHRHIFGLFRAPHSSTASCLSTCYSLHSGCSSHVPFFFLILHALSNVTIQMAIPQLNKILLVTARESVVH